MTRLCYEVDMSDWQTGQTIALPKALTHHLINVLRMKPNSSIELFDGQGASWNTILASNNKREAVVTLIDQNHASTESPLETHLGIAISRSDRFDFALQKATELGITQITPLISERSNIKQNKAHLEKKSEHWRKVILSACEQSGRILAPHFYEIHSLEEWLGQFKQPHESTLKCVLHPTARTNSHQAPFITWANTIARPSRVLFLTGPEGGFSETEINSATDSGFETIQLGERVLRTETAPLVFLSLLQGCWGDF